MKEGEELARLADSKGRVLMVGHILRYHPAIVQLQELIQEGALGKIQYVYSNRLNIGKIRTEENILWSFAPHDISVMLALLNETPQKISCQGGAYLNPHVFDVTLSQFSFPSGVQGHIFVSWLASSEGTAPCGGRIREDGRVRRYDRRQAGVVPPPGRMEEPGADRDQGKGRERSTREGGTAQGRVPALP